MISVTAPLSPALLYVKTVLFRPFDLEKWFALGFCAWLATLGQGGSNPPFGFKWDSDDYQNFSIDSGRRWVIDNLAWLIPLIIGATVIGIAVWVVFTWLSSRGQFMFLHGVATNHAEVRAPWKQFAAHAQSLFCFRVGIGIGTAILTVPLIIIAGFLVAPMIATQSIQQAPLFGAILLVFVAFAVGMIAFVIKYLTTSFVVPIMYISGNRCLEAWRTFRKLLMDELSNFVLYLLFLLLLHVCVGMAVLAAIIVTCCLAACILGIPFIGTVIMLPVAVFFRSYSLLFLSQFGAPYDAFRLESQAYVNPSG